MTSEQTFYIKTRKSCQTCISKEKSSPTFYIKNAKFISSYKPETSQQEEKEKEKKERKIGGKILTYLVLNFSLWKGCKKKKNQTTQSARIRFLIIDNIYVAIMVYGES